MENAIPPQFQCPRTQQKRMDSDFQPAFSAWTARGSHPQQQFVMLYWGVQWRSSDGEADALKIRDEYIKRIQDDDGAALVEEARFLDSSGWMNHLVIGYWRTLEDYTSWWDQQSAWWENPAHEQMKIGLFREVFLPHTTHLETVFNTTDQAEGLGNMLGRYSNSPIQEHGYWGGMRDRIPASQTDPLVSHGERILHHISPKRYVVIGHTGVTLIRSGQDYAHMHDTERQLYETRILPRLMEGMRFLEERGLEVGCYFNRFITRYQQDLPQERTFGMSVWRNLVALEEWAKSHTTHKAIFAELIGLVQRLNGKVNLKLYHEVAVLESQCQVYEYIGCHSDTGMLHGLETD